MPTQALLPILLLCVLLLQAQGGHLRRNKMNSMPLPPKEIQICEKRFKIHLCRSTCTEDRDCQANNICCLSFCGRICMNIL
uniref:WAP four-disulfide core domain 10A n=1 Tax=Pipistrellus kuhlii TaxID=59472 RepID=A0A7J7YCA9_PIPKU|nr:WAP four-disulfide core domain 10A [Pipistrellus kuhlii]